MKTTSLAALTATFGFAALLMPGCSDKQKVDQPQPTVAVPATPLPAVKTVVAPPQPVAVDAPASWDAISALTYEQRADFVAGAVRMEGQLDGQINGLKAKRASMTTDTKDWDFAMGGLTDARSYLQSMVTEVGKVTTPDTWDEEKEKVHQAWVRAQDAYDKVRISTTS